MIEKAKNGMFMTFQTIECILDCYFNKCQMIEKAKTDTLMTF